MRTERVDVGLIHFRRDVCELHREVAELALARGQVRLPVIVRGMFGELGWGALGTEVVDVCLRSVVAALLGGGDRRQQLALLP